MDQKIPQQPDRPQLSFRPLTEGLGFHPFSDGLPYAPIAKNPRSTLGLGAVQAGPPKMIVPPKMSAQVSRKLPQISVPVVKRPDEFPERLPSGLPLRLKISKTESQAVVDEWETNLLGYGYLLRRSFAFLMDLAITLFLFGAAVQVFVWRPDSNLELFENSSVLFVAVIFWGVFHWVFILAQEVAFKTSFGKWLLGLYLRGSRGMITLRAVFFLPSVGFFGFGLLSSFLDSKKRCWHDRMVDFQPVEKGRG